MPSGTHEPLSEGVAVRADPTARAAPCAILRPSACVGGGPDLRAIVRSIGPNPGAWFGSALVALGLLLVLYAAGMYADLLPGSRVTVPRPAALERTGSSEISTAIEAAAPQPATVGGQVIADAVAHPSASTTSNPVGTLPASAISPVIRDPLEPGPGSVGAAPPVQLESSVAGPGSVGQVAEATAVPVSRPVASPPPVETDPAVYASPMEAPDAEDRVPEDRIRPPAGLAVKLRIPSIDLATDAVPAGVITNGQGEPEWETVPFVAAHYVDTAPIGANGNAVISGHVVTIREGNVFRNLYKVDLGHTVEVDTESGTFTYVVEGLKLVKPEAVDVMAPTTDATLTLITCGGEFNPRTRQFSERLVVTAKLGNWAQLAGS